MKKKSNKKNMGFIGEAYAKNDGFEACDKPTLGEDLVDLLKKEQADTLPVSTAKGYLFAIQDEIVEHFRRELNKILIERN